MEDAEWLRTQLTSFGCAACGMGFAPEGIRVAAQRDGLFFVDLSCHMCGSGATALVTITVDDGAGPRMDDPELARVGPGVPVREPVGVDDVLDVHRLLAGHEGDLVALLRRFDGVEETLAR